MNSMPHDSAANDLAGTAERRNDSRETSEARVTIEVETTEFGGTSKNLSQAGVFFFSQDQLRVRVLIDDDQGQRTCLGSLVRVERMDAETTGFAIEFDQ